MRSSRQLSLQLFVLLATMLLLPPSYCVAQEDNSPPPGFHSLFNGRDLDGWHGMNMNPYKLAEMPEEERAVQRASDLEDVQQHWSVADGELINDGHGVYLTTNGNHSDMELWVDYKTVARADSGIYLRATPQVQIWDSTDPEKFRLGADKGSGGLWNNNPATGGKDPLVRADHSFGEWNRFRIRQVGARTTVWLNDQLVVQHAPMDNYWNRDIPLLREGPIQLQTHGGEIRWRNIFVRPISTYEANELLDQADDAGFVPIFNGQNLTGWKGAVESYHVVDGALRCRKGSGGHLFTEKEYDDFAVRLEFKLPPGGNNGLAIRYPGEGDPAYAGMCELQVLDSEHPKYENLDARQYHGSAYGISAAHRGYLRPTGEWNFQEVTVQGARIRVELNGYVILDTDVSQVTELMAGTPHPGKDLKQGHFGFCGHGDDVSFRNIRLKEL